jgi:hypothetical protein
MMLPISWYMLSACVNILLALELALPVTVLKWRYDTSIQSNRIKDTPSNYTWVYEQN